MMSEGTGFIEIRTGKVNGPLIAKLLVVEGSSMNTFNTTLKKRISGHRNLFIVSKSEKPIHIDWLSFK
jgi:hypothetical protein